MIEGSQFDKNSENPALIECRYSRRDESFGNKARRAAANGLELKQASPQLDRSLPYLPN
jgi:hypothetical protein